MKLTKRPPCPPKEFVEIQCSKVEVHPSEFGPRPYVGFVTSCYFTNHLIFHTLGHYFCSLSYVHNKLTPRKRDDFRNVTRTEGPERGSLLNRRSLSLNSIYFAPEAHGLIGDIAIPIVVIMDSADNQISSCPGRDA